MGERGRILDAQGKAPRATAEQLTGAQERWQRMTTAERQAVAARTDVKPILRKNLHGAKWENLNVDVQRKLQAAMEPIEAQPSDMKAFKPETGILHGIARLGVLLGGWLRRGFDLPVINGGGDGIARGTRELGSSMRGIQSGRIQQYMIVAIAVLVVGGLAFYYLVFMA